MSRYRKILAAIDGSDSSKNALREACRQVKKYNGLLTAMTVVPIHQAEVEVLTVRERIISTLRAECEKIVDEARKIAEEEDVFLRTKLVEGEPSMAIIDEAEEGGYDLVVVGREGQSHIEKVLMGSVAARIIGMSQSDVLVIPGDAAIAWRNILLVVERSKYLDVAAKKAMDIGKSYASDIVKAICVVDVTQTNS